MSTPKLGTPRQSITCKRCSPATLHEGSGRQISEGLQELHEFDFRKPQSIHQANGVTIRVFPAIHPIDGAVSFSLEWNGLRFIFISGTPISGTTNMPRTPTWPFTNGLSQCPTSVPSLGYRLKRHCN